MKNADHLISRLKAYYSISFYRFGFPNNDELVAFFEYSSSFSFGFLSFWLDSFL